MSDGLRQVLNAITFVIVIWVNGLAGSGALSGESIGLIANRYESYFLPAGYVFGIWSLIYLMLLGFTVYQALPRFRGDPALRRVGAWWAVSGALNVAWVVAFSYSRFGTAMVVMLALLLTLVVIHDRIGPEANLGWGGKIFLSYPFALYLAWIAVAVIANLSQYLTYLAWGGWGLSGPVWSAALMAVATGLGMLMLFRRGIWLFPPVVAWALMGIADRFGDVPLVATTAYASVAVGITALGVWFLRRRASPTAVP